MAQLIQSTYNEDVLLGTPWNLHLYNMDFQSLFDAIQKASGDIVTCFMATNILLSTNYLCDLFRRVAIFIPFIIYYQYECYKLTNRIYELAWKYYYFRNTSAFTSVPQQPMSNVSTHIHRRNSCSPSKQTDYGVVQAGEISRAGQSSSCVSASASAHVRPGDWNTLGMGDLSRRPSDGYGIPRVKSTPTMVRLYGKQGPHLIGVFAFNPLHIDNRVADELDRSSLIWSSNSNFHLNKRIQNTDLIAFSASVHPSMISQAVTHTTIPTNKQKKIKKHHEYLEGRDRSHDSVVMNIFLKPKDDQNPPKPLLKKKTPCNSRSEYTSTKSIATERFPLRTPSNMLVRNSIGKRSQSQSKAQAKTNNSVINFKPETECDRKWKNIFERAEALKTQRIKRMRELEMRKMQEKEKQRKIEIMKRRSIRAKIREENKRILMKDEEKKPSAGKSNEICLDVAVVENNSLDSLNLEGYGGDIFCGDPSARVPILRVTQRTVRIEHTSTRIGKNKGNKMKYSPDRNWSRTDNTFNVLEASDEIVDQHSEFFLLPTITQKAESTDSKGFVYIEMRSDKPYQNNFRESAPVDPDMKKSEKVISYWETTDENEITSSHIPSRKSWNGARNVSEPSVIKDDLPVQTLPVKSIASEFEKLAARGVRNKKAVSFTKLHDLRESTLDPGNHEVKNPLPKVDLLEASPPCELKPGRPVIRRIKRRLIKAPNETDVARQKESTKSENRSSRNDVPDLSCTLDAKGIYLTSLELKKLEVKKRLKERLRDQIEIPMKAGESLGLMKHVETCDKQTRPISAKNVKTILVKRNSGGGLRFSSKSSIALRDLASEKRPTKKLGRPLFTRAYTRKSPSVSSLVQSNNDKNKETPETGHSREGKGSKIFQHFSDSKKRISTGTRRKRRPRKKELSQLLDSFKSEIKESLNATALSLCSRLNETPQEVIEKSRSLHASEATSNDNYLSIHVTSGMKSDAWRSGGDMGSQLTNATAENNGKTVSGEIEKIDSKNCASQASNLLATVNPQPRWNNAAILRARYIEKTRPELKRNRKSRGENNCHSLPSSPRARPACSKQSTPPESSKSLPPTPR